MSVTEDCNTVAEELRDLVTTFASAITMLDVALPARLTGLLLNFVAEVNAMADRRFGLAVTTRVSIDLRESLAALVEERAAFEAAQRAAASPPPVAALPPPSPPPPSPPAPLHPSVLPPARPAAPVGGGEPDKPARRVTLETPPYAGDRSAVLSDVNQLMTYQEDGEQTDVTDLPADKLLAAVRGVLITLNQVLERVRVSPEHKGNYVRTAEAIERAVLIVDREAEGVDQIAVRAGAAADATRGLGRRAEHHGPRDDDDDGTEVDDDETDETEEGEYRGERSDAAPPPPRPSLSTNPPYVNKRAWSPERRAAASRAQRARWDRIKGRQSQPVGSASA